MNWSAKVWASGKARMKNVDQSPQHDSMCQKQHPESWHQFPLESKKSTFHRLSPWEISFFLERGAFDTDPGSGMNACM
jgi:hypothetical protein